MIRSSSPNLKSGQMDRKSLLFLLTAIVASVFLIYIFPLVLSTPLFDPDEGIHAAIAQEMVDRSDYLIPRYLGTPFRDKPILYFAAQGVSLRDARE